MRALWRADRDTNLYLLKTCIRRQSLMRARALEMVFEWRAGVLEVYDKTTKEIGVLQLVKASGGIVLAACN